jgi:hypothetical protein
MLVDGLRGYDCEIVMPDDVAIEKVLVLEALGAKVVRVRPGALDFPLAFSFISLPDLTLSSIVLHLLFFHIFPLPLKSKTASIVDQTQFVNLARARALAFGETIITSLPSVKDELLHNAPHHIHHHATSDLPLAATTGDLGRADENGRGEDDLVVSDQSPPGERGEGWKEGKGKRGFFANQFENPVRPMFLKRGISTSLSLSSETPDSDPGLLQRLPPSRIISLTILPLYVSTVVLSINIARRA